MFFQGSASQESQYNINKFILNEWISLAIFFEDIIDSSDEYYLNGYGVITKPHVSQYYNDIVGHIFKLNQKYYIFTGYNIEGLKSEHIKFRSIIEVNQDFIDGLSKTANDFYKDLESSLSVDFKHYSYPFEERIAMTKKGEGGVDMYASYSLKTDDGFFGKIYPATFVAAKNQVLTNALNERLANIKGSK